MGGLYHDGNRRLQERFDTVRLADRIEEDWPAKRRRGLPQHVDAFGFKFLQIGMRDWQVGCSFQIR